jgi:hypothetical protein
MNTRDFDWKPLALVPALALLVLPFIGSPRPGSRSRWPGWPWA